MEISSIKAWAEADRPREKMINQGRHTLTDSELLAILLRSGSGSESAVELSRRILQSVQNDLTRLSRLTVNELSKFKGMGNVKSITIIAALELGRRRRLAEGTKNTKISSSTDAAELFLPDLSDLLYEEFWILLLNRANHIISKIQISKGGVTGTVVDPKLIFKAAVESTASGIILFHNHPSGNKQPSDADISLTKKLREAGNLLDIQVLDHIIIAGNSFYSFADEGRL
ncbi:MAG: DNA repair protein RadC [Bacteroidetes bacterium]|nr:DNA repair protein RadC [Bacteroidota bacterium]